jgi:hypothetical protein
MKYIIFGIVSDKIPAKISLSKADLVTVNLELALQRFDDACKSFKYKHLYLICDFEPNKHLKYAPYYIMEESHLGFNTSTVYKHSYIVENAGFTHIFADPLKAFKEFMGYVNNDEYVRLSETTSEGYDYKNSSILYGSTKRSNTTIVADTTLAKNPSKRLILFYNKKYDIGNYGYKPNLHCAVILS